MWMGNVDRRTNKETTRTSERKTQVPNGMRPPPKKTITYKINNTNERTRSKHISKKKKTLGETQKKLEKKNKREETLKIPGQNQAIETKQELPK